MDNQLTDNYETIIIHNQQKYCNKNGTDHNYTFKLYFQTSCIIELTNYCELCFKTFIEQNLSMIFQEDIWSTKCLCIIYYSKIIKNYDLMAKYMLEYVINWLFFSTDKLDKLCDNNNWTYYKTYCNNRIKNNNDVCCMNGLANYYQIIEHNNQLMIDYYLMAIEHNNTTAMCELGSYYETSEQYDLMKKYWLMAIDKGCFIAMYLLGAHYNRKQNIQLSTKYWLMAIEKGSIDAIQRLRSFMPIIQIYVSVQNKQFVIDNTHGRSLVILKKYINSTKYHEICNICFNQTDCISQNNQYLCGVCLWPQTHLMDH